MKVTIIIGANRVRGVAKLKGIENDVQIFTSISQALSKSGYSFKLNIVNLYLLIVIFLFFQVMVA